MAQLRKRHQSFLISADETITAFFQASLLPAHVEITLAEGDIPAARDACTELEAIAERWGGMTDAMAAHARGAVDLADGNARSALASLSRVRTTNRTCALPMGRCRVRQTDRGYPDVGLAERL